MTKSAIKATIFSLALIWWISIPFVLLYLLRPIHYDTFIPWVAFNGPPHGAVHILNTSPSEVSVLTSDGKTFYYSLSCYGGNRCYQWIEGIGDFDLSRPNTLKRGVSCVEFESAVFPLNPLPLNPLSHMTECVYDYSLSDLSPYEYETYFALMSDGGLYHWEYQGFIFDRDKDKTFYLDSTFVDPTFIYRTFVYIWCPFSVVLALVFFLVNIYMQQTRRRNSLRTG